MNGHKQKWKTVTLVAIAEFLAMSLWFSASAVTPLLINEWQINAGQAAWLTMSVQIGFVIGALISTLFNLADIFRPRTIFALGTLIGSLANLAIIAVAGGENRFQLAILMRLVTGASLALVYPVGMKIMATWMKKDRGLGIGLLVGALTLGSASPHLLRAFGSLMVWRPVLVGASILALLGGIIALTFGKLGPFQTKAPPFNWRYLGSALLERGLRLANFGYLGHMWELYAMWTWIPLFITASLAEYYQQETLLTPQARFAALLTFAVIGIGGVGSLLAGALADRWGRTSTTIVSMGVSGVCALVIGFTYGRSPLLVAAVALIWGFAIVADSAQFSTAVSELAEERYMGTALTLQTTLGFLLTIVSIRLTPYLANLWGWQWAFVLLAVGPAFGIWAMMTLRQSPLSERLANGRG